MTSKMSTKVRLVRCPRCRLVLAELAEVPVYKCGGCDAVLQAKNSKRDSKDTASSIVEADPTQKHKLEQTSEHKEAECSNQTEGPDKNSIQNESADCMREQLGCVNHSYEPRSSTELSSHGSAESSPDTRDRMAVDEEKDPQIQNESTDRSREEQIGCVKYSDEPRSSTELSSHENADSSPDTRVLIESDEEASPLAQYKRSESQSESQSECGESDREEHQEKNISNENESLSAQIGVDKQDNGRDPSEFGDSSRELPAESINCVEEKYLSTDITCDEAKEQSQVAEADTEADENLKSRSTFKSLIAEKLLDTRLRRSDITSQSPLDEEILSDNEREKQTPYSNLQGFERISSTDTLENAPLNDPGYYDGSVSSFDGNDDQFADLHLLRSKRNSVFNSKGLPNRDDLRGAGAENVTAMELGESHRYENGSRWHNHSHPVRDMMRLEPEEHRSRLPVYSRGSRDVYGNAIASTSNSGINDNPASEKLELLRMVYELQEQLNRANISKGKANAGLPTRVAKQEKQIPSYYDHLAAGREIYRDFNYPRCRESYGQGKSWSQPCQPTRMGFYGKSTHVRSQVDCSCYHCCPQDHHFSAQIPQHVVCCNNGHYGTHPSHFCYRSGPSSPQHQSGSEFSVWSHEAKPDVQWHNRTDRKHHSPKRHLRAIAGGAPLIACYLCSELLQLPADFLLFERKFHSLRCSACSKVLKFSLQSKTCLVPYVPEAIAPPTSEVDDYTADRIKESRYHGLHAAEPVSCSDDYGQSSFRKSYSTETDRFPLGPPFHAHYRNSNGRKMSSVSSFEPPMNDRKKSNLKETRNGHNNPVQNLDSAGPSSKRFQQQKISSEIEEIQPRAGSPLHRLMGYSSPSRVIRQ